VRRCAEKGNGGLAFDGFGLHWFGCMSTRPW
jgi:hypothetical protein